MKKSDRWALVIPSIMVGLVLLLNVIPAWRSLDYLVYDWLLYARPEIEEDERFLIVEVDDASIARVGNWPWSRDILADGLWRMREFGADRAVFDIEYMDTSPSGVNRTILEEQLPGEVSRGFGDVLGNSLDLIAAVSDGRVPAEEALEFEGQLREQAAAREESLLDRMAEIARDNDEYMARAAEVFGDAYYTITLLSEPTQIAPTTAEDLEFAKEQYAVGDAPDLHPLERAQRIQPVIRPIGRRAAGAGFTNIHVDSDGVRRRINLLAEYDGTLFGQLAFVPLWDLLGRPDIEIDGSTVVLRDALHPEEETPDDIRIPLSTGGRFVINWPRKTFRESFRHTSFARVLRYNELGEALAENLELMNSAGYFGFYDGTSPLDYERYASDLRRDVMAGDASADRLEEYREVREAYYDELGNLLSGDTETAVLDRVGEFIDGTEDEDERAEYEAIAADARDLFAATQDVYDSATELRGELASTYEDSFAIIGQTGVGTVDIGVNPFEGQYFNVGTHAAVPNTILQEEFLRELPRWVSLVVALVMGLTVALWTARLDTKKSILVGILALVLAAAGGSALFIVTGVFLPLGTPLTAIALAFVASSVVSSLRNSAERAFLRNAFSRYLSADVIGQIIDDPSKLSLGGDKKYLTAMFTDVQGFSTISEKLDPSDLVRLLNAYLTAMSDIVLDVRGTIDKYEGDAIIAFFGAPVDDPDHAMNACRSAVRMKRVELELNERFLAENLTPSPLATRIGINTGDMVVGNMGTERKMDYTVMGHAVNLAARLEGVNKQYGSYILVSEATRMECGDEFVFRAFDRVRVVGVTEPVQLYELLDERSSVSADLLERVDEFHSALDLFRAQKFVAAEKLFSDIANRAPSDAPAKTYAERCRKLAKNPPSASWDGVYSLTQK
ncbi:MAG: CHASE2 domain-containing protein [Spirochaetales bacterium]